MFMRFLISIVNASNHATCVLLSNQKCMIQHILTNLDPNKHSHLSMFIMITGRND